MIVGAANVGIGFAVPINRAKGMLEDYRTQGSRPLLGVSGRYMSGELAEALDLPSEGGILVFTVQPSSPAAQAGVRGARQRAIIGNYEIPIGGDFIMAIDGKAVESDASLRRATRGKRAGDNVELTVFRNGRMVKVPVRLGRGEQAL